MRTRARPTHGSARVGAAFRALSYCLPAASRFPSSNARSPAYSARSITESPPDDRGIVVAFGGESTAPDAVAAVLGVAVATRVAVAIGLAAGVAIGVGLVTAVGI